MTTPFSYIHTKGKSFGYMMKSGKFLTISDPSVYATAVSILEDIINTSSSDPAHSDLRDKLESATDVKKSIIKSMSDLVTIENDEVLRYNGYVFDNSLTKRIVAGARDGENMTAYVTFLENLMANPSNQTITEVYSFMEQNSMGITEDGYLLAYKKITDDYKDIYTKTIDNSVGSVVSMPRGLVNDNRHETCSHGLHACSMSYLPHYGIGTGTRVVIVKINPKDVVSIPVDYNNAKLRCCEYEVISEYSGDDLGDLLASKRIWVEDDFNFGTDADDLYDEDGEYLGSSYDDDDDDYGYDEDVEHDALTDQDIVEDDYHPDAHDIDEAKPYNMAPQVDAPEASQGASETVDPEYPEDATDMEVERSRPAPSAPLRSDNKTLIFDFKTGELSPKTKEDPDNPA